MRARRSSRSDSGVSIVNGRIAVASADRSAMTAMWVLLGEDGGEVTARSLLVSSAHCARREPWVAHGVAHWAARGSPFAQSLGSALRHVEVVCEAVVAVNGAEITAPAQRPACVLATRCTGIAGRDPVHQWSIPVANPGNATARSRT